MDNVTPEVRGLAPAQIEQFISDGFVRIDHAFPRALADAALRILWKATGCQPDDPATWTQPVIRLGMFTQAPFVEAANTLRLHAAFDQLVGERRWLRPAAMGTFPVRFPSAVDPGDAGWHIDVSFGTATPARFTCVIRSWCTRHSSTKASGHDSWRNLRCFPRTRTTQ